MGKTFFWGQRKLTDDERLGRPSMSWTDEKNLDKVCQIVCGNRWLTVRSIAGQVNIYREKVRKILTEDLDMRKMCAKMVPNNSLMSKSKELKFAKTFWRSKMVFWTVSSQVMSHGSTNTTLKQSGKVHNGRLPILHAQKSFVSQNQKSRQYCWRFWC